MSNVLTTPSRTTANPLYDLTFNAAGLPISCTCPGVGYRGTCRHINEHTAGGFQVTCDACNTTVLAAAKYAAARQFARKTAYRCTGCGTRELLVVPTSTSARPVASH